MNSNIQQILDRCAIESNGHFSWPLDVPMEDIVPEDYGYAFRRIATFGTGNSGFTVLTGLTARTRNLLWQGRVNNALDLGASPVQAEVIASTRGPHVREDAVIKAALRHYRSEAWVLYPGIYKGVWRWLVESYLTQTLGKMTVPRIEAVFSIVVGLRGLEGKPSSIYKPHA